MDSSENIRHVLAQTASVTAQRRRATIAAMVSATLVAVAISVATTDVVVPLSDELRQQVWRWWPALPAVALAYCGWRWWRSTPTPAATLRLAETAFADRERRLTAAAELATMPGPLAARASAAIAAAFPAHQLAARLPAGGWQRWLLLATLGAGLITAVTLTVPDLASTLWLRFSDPTGDHPPWARVRLAWTTTPERVRSGGLIHVEIIVSGETADTPVLHGGGTPVVMFPLGAGQWAGELAGITTPVVLWAEAGGTRSLRHAVGIDPLPHLDGLTLTLNSPAWARLAPETVVWKSGVISEVQALPGSRLVLRPLSNRPLAALVIHQGDQDQRLELSQGAVDLPVIPGPLSVSLLASDGMQADALAVALISPRVDAPPRLAITRPTHDILATSDRTVVVEFTAEDDLGLAEVVEVSAVNGREAAPRRRALPGERRWTHTRSLDLAALGARAGDVVVLGALVRDVNPQVIDGEHGQASAFASRTIRVISDEEYNQQLRNRLPVDALEQKYADVIKRLQELESEASALREAAAAAASPELDRRLAELGRKAAALAADVRALHRDHPLYEIEHDVQAALAEAAEQLAKAADGGDAKQLPDRQRGRMLAADLAHLTELARAHGLAARLAQIADAEQNTSGRLAPLAEHRRVSDADRVRLRELAGDEDQLATAAEAWPGVANEIVERLRPTDPDTAGEVAELARQVKDSGVAELKRQAAAAARAGDGATAMRLAGTARDRLLALLPRSSRCQGACRGSAGLSFSWCSGSHASDAMGLGFGFGEGGWGAGGSGSGGLGLLLGYGGNDQGGSLMPEGFDLNGPEALGDVGNRSGDRNGAGVADLAAAGDGRTTATAAAYQRGVRATSATNRAHLEASEERLIGDYLRRLIDGEPVKDTHAKP